MAKVTVTKPEEQVEKGIKGLFEKSKNFLLDVKSELEKVTWPTIDDLKVSTKVTMILLGIMSVVIFAFDISFSQIMIFLLSILS